MTISSKLYEVRITTHLDELDRNPNDRPIEGRLYITAWLDTGNITTESYYVCESLKTVYESFVGAIKQANADGFIPDSVASIWAEPDCTTLIKNPNNGSGNLVDKDGNLIFADGAQGISINSDFAKDGNRVFFVTSLIKIEQFVSHH